MYRKYLHDKGLFFFLKQTAALETVILLYTYIKVTIVKIEWFHVKELKMNMEFTTRLHITIPIPPTSPSLLRNQTSILFGY